MIKFEDLKIGDKLIIEGGNPKGDYMAVIAIGPECALAQSVYFESNTSILREKDCQYWSYYTPPKQKKMKLMSPALIWVSLYGFQTQLSVGTWLYETEEAAKKCIAVERFHSWPAKDAHGNPIQIAVEVEDQ